MKFVRLHSVSLRILVLFDANWGRETEVRSQGGYFILLAQDKESDENGILASIIAWKSWKLKRVAVSTLDAKCQAGHDAMNMAIYVQNFLKWMYGTEGYPIDIRSDCKDFVDAAATTKRCMNPRTHVQVQAVRDELASGNIRSLKHISGKANLADVLTKEGLVMLELFQQFLETGLVKNCK